MMSGRWRKIDKLFKLELLNKDELIPYSNEFSAVLSDKQYTDYTQKLSNHIMVMDGFINQFKKGNYDIECITAESIKQSWSYRESIIPPPTFINLKDSFIRVSFYKSNSLEKYDVYFCKSAKNSRIFIVQLQLYRF